MITVTSFIDIYGKDCKQYRLNQGDSFRFKAVTKSESELISKVTFKLSHKNYCQMFSKDYAKHDDGSWILFVESNETEEWPVSEENKFDYHTEIEITYTDGGVDTVEEAELKVDPQIKECGGV